MDIPPEACLIVETARLMCLVFLFFLFISECNGQSLVYLQAHLMMFLPSVAREFLKKFSFQPCRAILNVVSLLKNLPTMQSPMIVNSRFEDEFSSVGRVRGLLSLPLCPLSSSLVSLQRSEDFAKVGRRHISGYPTRYACVVKVLSGFLVI